MRILVLLGIVSLLFLAGCGGSTASALNNQPPPPTGVTVTPANATVQVGGVQQFTATVSPSGADQAVTWSVRGIGCTGASCGTIDATGKYTAPATVPSPNTVVVSASSVADSSRAAIVPVIIITSENNPVPMITSLSPDCAPVGGQAFALLVNGSNFVSSSVVRWNGSDRPTTVYGGAELIAQIPASDIAAGGTPAVTVFDPAPGGGSSNPVTLTIATGGLHPAAIAVDPTGKFAYVANGGCPDAFTGNVSMYTIDSTTGALTSIGSPVPADFGPHAMTVDPSGKVALVANDGAFEVTGGSISTYTINATTGALTSTGTIAAPCAPPPTPGSCAPFSVVVHPSGKFAYVANEGGFAPTSISMYNIDAATGALTSVGLIAAGGRAIFVAVHPSGKFAYVVTSSDPGSVGGVSTYTVDAATGGLTSVGTISAQGFPGWVVIHPSGNFAYVTSSAGVSTYTINITTGTLTSVGTIAAGQSLIAIHPSGKFAYGINGSNNVSMYSIDAATGALTSIGPIAAGLSPTSITIHPSGKFAYVANSGSNNVSMYSIDAATGALTFIGTIGT